MVQPLEEGLRRHDRVAPHHVYRLLSHRQFSGRLRPDGTIVPLNSLIIPPQNRTDLRVQQRIALPGRVSIDGIVEVFNMFNRPNWTIGTQESTFNQYLQHTNAQYRTAQVGFRLTL